MMISQEFVYSKKTQNNKNETTHIYRNLDFEGIRFPTRFNLVAGGFVPPPLPEKCSSNPHRKNPHRKSVRGQASLKTPTAPPASASNFC